MDGHVSFLMDVKFQAVMLSVRPNRFEGNAEDTRLIKFLRLVDTASDIPGTSGRCQQINSKVVLHFLPKSIKIVLQVQYLRKTGRKTLNGIKWEYKCCTWHHCHQIWDGVLEYRLPGNLGGNIDASTLNDFLHELSLHDCCGIWNRCRTTVLVISFQLLAFLHYRLE